MTPEAAKVSIDTKLDSLLVIYTGSNGDATTALYQLLEQRGPIGVVAVNLFRAMKNSERAKVYRGGIPGKGSYRRMAYDRKQWAMNNLCRVLSQYAGELGVVWGWKRDPLEPVHGWVLYVELPTGQISFHTGARGDGPDFAGEWDGQRRTGPTRLCRWIASL